MELRPLGGAHIMKPTDRFFVFRVSARVGKNQRKNQRKI
jgi:hypothetical protein